LWLQPGRKKSRDLGGGLGNPTGLLFFGGLPAILIFWQRNSVSFTQRTQRSQRGALDTDFFDEAAFQEFEKEHRFIPFPLQRVLLFGPTLATFAPVA
jgi:hypothetical protein